MSERTGAWQDWELRLHQSFSAVKQWDSMLNDPPEPSSGSELALDDAAGADFPLTPLAWQGVATAIDHLGLLADLSDLPAPVMIRPLAPFTTTRTALAGASQAVWLLSPDARELRLERALRVWGDEYRNYAVYLKELAESDVIRGALGAWGIKDLEKVRAQSLSRRAAAENRLGRRAPLVQTTMMKEAAEYFAQTTRPDPWAAAALAYEWRLSSGAAHARLWPMHVRPGSRPDDPLQPDSGSFSSSGEEYAQSVGAAVLMTNLALNLWTRRGEKPERG